MDDREKLALIFEEVGPRDDEIEEIRRLGEDSWLVSFLDVDIEAEFDPGRGRLLLSSDLGAPPSESRLHIYETMMAYSRFARVTGGVHMSLDEPGGNILQMVDLDCASLTPDSLALVLHNLVERTTIWRGFVEGRADFEQPPAPEPDQPLIRI